MARISPILKTSMTPFGQLEKSNLFKHGDDFFLKVALDERRKSNAVSLTSGNLTVFNDTDMVETSVTITLE